jgi:putative heme-binding domain-containing protein
VFFSFWIWTILCIGYARAQRVPIADAGSSSVGKHTFTVRCAGCHGLDGRGGERAPNIVTNPAVRKMSDAQLARIIANGMPDFGMPAFRLIGPNQINSVVRFLRTWDTGSSAAFAGNAQRGKAIFFGKGECSSCHMVSGQGGFLGPDLSSFGQSLTPTDIRSAITDARRVAVKTVTAVTRDGQKITGVVRNEDNFSIQLQAPDGQFHFVLRSDLREFNYGAGPAMPPDYGKKLSPQELDDLVKFLHTVAGSAKSETGGSEEE